MSWYRDPQLFIYSSTYVYRIRKAFGMSPIMSMDLLDYEPLNFFKHLYLGNNKETDYDAFKASCFPAYEYGGISKFINCQGFVIIWNFDKQIGTWSHEESNSPFWSLPGILPDQILAELRSLREENSQLKSKSSKLEEEISKRFKTEETAAVLKKAQLETAVQLQRDKEEKEAVEVENGILKAQVNRERDEKEAMNIKVSELEAENTILKAEINKVRDEISALVNAFAGEVSDLESNISTLEEECKRVKKEKEAIEAENAVLQAQVRRDKDEKEAIEAQLKRDRDEKEAMNARVLDLEAGNTILEAKVGKERDEKEAVNARVLDLETGNAILQADVSKEKDEKEAMNTRILDLEAEISILKAQVNKISDEEEAISTRVLDLEAENAILKADQLNRVRDVNNAFKGEDMLAGLELLEKQVADLTSKLMFPQ